MFRFSLLTLARENMICIKYIVDVESYIIHFELVSVQILRRNLISNNTDIIFRFSLSKPSSLDRLTHFNRDNLVINEDTYYKWMLDWPKWRKIVERS